MKCPNKSHPDWKTLVEEWGETRATQMYIDNNYEIPSSGSNDTKVGNEFGKSIYTPKSTFSLLRDTPSVTKQFVDLQRTLDPKVKINEDYIFDESGKYRSIEPGQEGMHHNNALHSLISWANDKKDATPPYEYIQEIAEMYKESDFVRDQLGRLGNVESMANAFTRYNEGMKVSDSFKSYVPKFWNRLKGLYGNPDANAILTEAFRKNANDNKGTAKGALATTKFQKAGVQRRYSNGYDSSDMTKTKVNQLPVKEAAKRKLSDIIAINNITQSNWEQLGFKVYSLVNEFKNTHTVDSGGVKTYKGNINESYLDELTSHLENRENAIDFLKAIKEKTDLPTAKTKDGKVLFTDLIGSIHNANEYKNATLNNMILEDGSLVSLDEAATKTTDDIDHTKSRRDAIYKKIPWKPVKNFLRKVEKAIQFQTNSMLDAKYLSGSEDSLLSRISYKALFWGENMRNKNILDFNKKLMEDSFSENYDNWSHYKNKDATIDQLNTSTFQGTIEGSTKKTDIPLTKAEMLSVYLMGRQKRAAVPMAEHGVYLGGQIEGRNLPVNKAIKFDPETLKDIAQEVMDDPDLMKVVENIDDAMNFIGDKVKNTFKLLNGIDLRMEEYYFPMYAGKQSFEMRKGKSAIEDWKSLHTSRGENKPIRIVDPIQVVNSYKAAASTYASLALPIRNLKKLIKKIEPQYRGTHEQTYIDQLKDIANILEDTSMLYSTQGEEEVSKFLNKVNSNFSVAVLGMNVPVMLKQSISYITAAQEIEGQYLKMAGYGTSLLPVINPRQILDAIEYTGTKKGATVLPIEWNLDTNSGVFARMKELSPMLEVRLEGMITREMGEAMMNMDKNEDLITLPWKKKDGSKYRVSKARLMEGIRVFDAVTIANIWKAAEFEAEGKYGLKRGTPEFDEHVAIRVETIVSKTQPDWNLTNRSTAALSRNPIMKFLTMFSSATSKMGMLQLDSIITLLANPSKENQMKLLHTTSNIMVMTAITVAAINMLKSLVLYGYDDDDDLFKRLAKDFTVDATVNALGIFYGIGQIARVVGSQLDDKPFFQSLQSPELLITQDIAGAIANFAKGNLWEANKKALESTFKLTGLPMFPLISTRQAIKRTTGIE